MDHEVATVDAAILTGEVCMRIVFDGKDMKITVGNSNGYRTYT